LGSRFKGVVMATTTAFPLHIATFSAPSSS
jgi:hypothetical protein